MKKAFPHNFKPLFYTLPLDVNGVNGYTKALTHLYLQLADMTGFKPENRMIDAVVLLDMIAATNEELSELMNAEQERLKKEESEKMYKADLLNQKNLS